MRMLGVDVGGTFTDILVMSEDKGHLIALKVPSNRKAPEESIIRGLKLLEERHAVAPNAIHYFSHGTTLGVNTLLERDGAEVCLLTTKGFRDILELRRLRVAALDANRTTGDRVETRESRSFGMY